MKYIMIIIVLFLLACSTEYPNQYYPQKPTGAIDIRINEVELETIELEQVASSLAGRLYVHNETLRFVDYMFGWIFEYDTEGNLLNRKMGRERGPSELSTSGRVQFFTKTPNDKLLFYGASYDYQVFDENLERIQESIIRWKQDKPIDFLVSNIVPEDHRSYNIMYDIGVVKANTSHAIIPLTGGFPTETVFHIASDDYARHARLIAVKDIESGEVELIAGRFPPIYEENPNSRALPFFFYDLLDEQTIAFSFMADTLVHIFKIEQEDLKHVSSFGRKGNGMNMNYEDISDSASNPNRLSALMRRQFDEKDFYLELSYIQETGLLFRSYRKSNNDNNDGVQIYKDGVLIGDIEVPNLTTIVGYNTPYYYTSAYIDEDNETKTVYRFKLEL